MALPEVSLVALDHGSGMLGAINLTQSNPPEWGAFGQYAKVAQVDWKQGK